MKEKVISRAQYLDLFHTQSITLYMKILNLPHPTISNHQIVSTPTGSNVDDGILGFVRQQSKGKKKSSKSTQTLAIQDSLAEILYLKAISKINVAKSSTGKGQSSKGKNKKMCLRKRNPLRLNLLTRKGNLIILSLYVNEDHYTKECPQWEEVTKVLKFLQL